MAGKFKKKQKKTGFAAGLNECKMWGIFPHQRIHFQVSEGAE
jgi:hypothetical protein